MIFGNNRLARAIGLGNNVEIIYLLIIRMLFVGAFAARHEPACRLFFGISAIKLIKKSIALVNLREKVLRVREHSATFRHCSSVLQRNCWLGGMLINYIVK